MDLILKNNFQDIKSKKYSTAKLTKSFENIFYEIKKDVLNETKTLNVLSKKFKFNFNLTKLNRFKKFKTLAVIGMGGSILGTEAIYNFLEKKIKKKIYFFDNLDEENIKKFQTKENKSKVLFIVISKSGNTIETLTNTFLLKILKKNAKNIIIISERKNNVLFKISKQMNLFYVEHKSHVGGRYSVFSEVGIVPAYIMGLNINKLRSEILECFKKNGKIFLKRSVIELVKILESKKFSNLIFLNYAPNLEKFLYWCQQLIAESLGKKKLGFLPMISNTPKDHHSLLQLYLDGPKDKLFYIFSDETHTSHLFKSNLKIHNLSFLEKKSLSKIKEAQKNALIKSLRKKKIPFREFKITRSNEQIIGKLFSYFILETVIVGRMLNINPFDQPAVEEVKIFTKKILS